ncbi:hypothetical protein NM208_g3822 [Fusarium decemcellulare]|uniref:Uncharacterized protein n=1 Tax=Fusarium decemcellulare TaxID=57161 RepID=A0ACC1SML7_9HYPO|nr:hypothetical protein NM208_g3822 [Fusarium decemcellulare]
MPPTWTNYTTLMTWGRVLQDFCRSHFSPMKVAKSQASLQVRTLLTTSPGEAEYDDDDKVPILLNGKYLRVFPNLYDALLQLHHSYRGVPFWIDASTERAAQVGIMNQICRQADKVTIWLGKITDRDQIQRGADIGKVYAQVVTRQVLGIVEVFWGDISVPWDDLGIVATFLQSSSLAAELNFRFSGSRSSIQELDVVGDGFLGAMRWI